MSISDWSSDVCSSDLNLRGLGIKRTLVLLNNRRLVAGGTGANSSPDLNMIPVVALARTDVLKDGASAIYGADAMAGGVNLITRNDYEGLGGSAPYGAKIRREAVRERRWQACEYSGDRVTIK